MSGCWSSSIEQAAKSGNIGGQIAHSYTKSHYKFYIVGAENQTSVNLIPNLPYDQASLMG